MRRNLSSFTIVLASLILTNCGPPTEEPAQDLLESTQRADTAWPDGSYARIRDDGRLYATHPYTDLTYLHVIAAAAGSDWAAAHPLRFNVMLSAMNEVYAGRCGDVARARYNATGEWCTEFARWNLLNAGVENAVTCGSWVRTCSRGGCTPYTCGYDLYLSDARAVSHMIKLFTDFGGFTAAAQMTRSPYTVQPGDYLAMDGGSGPNTHSSTALAVSNDYRWIWVANGNQDDCVGWQRLPYFTNGVLNPNINGVGNIDAL